MTLTADDIAAIQDLGARYAHHVDRRTFEGLRDVFVPDAVLEPPGSVRNGIDEMLATMANLHRYEATFHFVGQHRIWEDGGAVSGEAYCEAHHITVDDDGGARRDRVMFIRYQDRYVATASGWRIAHRKLEVDWTDDRQVG